MKKIKRKIMMEFFVLILGSKLSSRDEGICKVGYILWEKG